MGEASTLLRRGRKFDQVLEGARKVFLDTGFERANMDDVARVAGVSKATLYSYFPDKRLLFTEVVRTECERQAESAAALVEVADCPRKVLRFAAEKIIEFYLSDFGLRVYRICLSESERFPELGRLFYDSGPKQVRDRLGDYLGLATERGELTIDDPGLAADQFGALCRAGLFARRAFNVDRDYCRAEADRVATSAVDMFMARYGTETRRAG